MPAYSVKLNPIKINLLPGTSDFSKTTWGKILLWALSFGRYIVVFTELIVILAFLARFKLDRDLTDLHDSIEQKKAIVSSASVLEENFRNLQKRLTHIEGIEAQQGKLDYILIDMAKFVPLDVSITNLSLDKGGFKITGTALSEAGLATLIYQFRNSPRYSEISVDNINKSVGSPLIQFTLTTALTPEAFL